MCRWIAFDALPPALLTVFRRFRGGQERGATSKWVRVRAKLAKDWSESCDALWRNAVLAENKAFNFPMPPPSRVFPWKSAAALLQRVSPRVKLIWRKHNCRRFRSTRETVCCEEGTKSVAWKTDTCSAERDMFKAFASCLVPGHRATRQSRIIRLLSKIWMDKEHLIFAFVIYTFRCGRSDNSLRNTRSVNLLLLWESHRRWTEQGRILVTSKHNV